MSSCAVTRHLYRSCLRAARRLDRNLEAAKGISLSEIGDKAIRANAFQDFLEEFEDDWDWGDALLRNEAIMTRIEGGGQHRDSWTVLPGSRPDTAVEATRVAFRSGEDLDEGFEQLAALSEQSAVLETMEVVLAPQDRDSRIDFNVGEVLTHPRYGWKGVVLGYNNHCRMDQSWVEENVQEDDEDRVREIHSGPWYDILCNDGILRYGSQLTHKRCASKFEFVSDATMEGEMILEVLFEGWDEETQRFLANEDLAKRYPDSPA